MQFDWYWQESAACSFSKQEGVDVMTNKAVNPLPWSRWDDDSGSFSFEDERFLWDALSHLTDEKDLEESEPCSLSLVHSPPSLLPQQPQQEEQPLIVQRPKVKRTSPGKFRRLCQRPTCGKIDRGHGFCGAHGGGKRCSMELCEKASRKRGFCTFHFHLFHEETSRKNENK